MPSRRAYLASLAALAPLGGCQAPGNSATPSPTATPDSIVPLGTPQTVDGVTITPQLAWTQHTAFTYWYPEVVEIESFDGEVLFVGATVEPHWDDLEASDLHLESPDAVAQGGIGLTSDLVQGRFPSPEGLDPVDLKNVGIVVDEPDDVGDDAVLRWDPTIDPPARPRWRLPDDVVTALQAEPPDFVVEKVILPDSVLPGSEIEVVFEVRNDGGPGTFRALVRDPAARWGSGTIELELDAGEREVTGTTIEIPENPDGSTVAIPIETADGTEEYTVPLAE